jgi:hypothetical protein
MLWPDERWPRDIGVLAALDGTGLFGKDSWFRGKTRLRIGARRRTCGNT